MMTTAMPRRRDRSFISSRICAWMVTSSAVVGSSAISSFGLQAEPDGDHHPLAHAARQLVRILVEPAFGVGDADQRQQLDRPGARRRIVHAEMDGERLHDLQPDPAAPD